MRRLIYLLLTLLLAACETGTIHVEPASEWTPRSTDVPVTIQGFREVAEVVGSEARAECRRQRTNANCDFRILVDLNPRAPANAYQTLDDDDRPVIIFTQAMIRSAQNVDELAFVMGHEAAHHVLGHIARQRENARIGAANFGETERQRGKSDAEVEEAQKIGAKVAVQTYAKDFELEADQLGTIITHNAGYNPRIGAKYFARIPDPGDRFLGSHPPNAQRVEIVRQTARKLGVTE